MPERLFGTQHIAEWSGLPLHAITNIVTLRAIEPDETDGRVRLFGETKTATILGELYDLHVEAIEAGKAGRDAHEKKLKDVLASEEKVLAAWTRTEGTYWQRVVRAWKRRDEEPATVADLEAQLAAVQDELVRFHAIKKQTDQLRAAYVDAIEDLYRWRLLGSLLDNPPVTCEEREARKRAGEAAFEERKRKRSRAITSSR
jgi:hypothetical protein